MCVDRFTSPSNRFRASVLCDPKGIATRPIARFLYRLSAPVRWWKGTIAHMLVLEIRSLPRRISDLRQEESFPLDFVRLPRDPRPNHSVLPIADACSVDIEKLRQSTGCMFPLGMNLYSRAFGEGALWMLRNCSPIESPKAAESSVESIRLEDQRI
jgi:hypothetical protein